MRFGARSLHRFRLTSGAAMGMAQGLSVPARHQLRGQARRTGARQLSDPAVAVSSPAWAWAHDPRSPAGDPMGNMRANGVRSLDCWQSMQKFVLRSALRPNQISFSHSPDSKTT
jgi:hypothetical protein